MGYNPKDVEKYILLSHDPKRRRTVDRQLLYCGRLYSLWAIIVFALFNVYIWAILDDYSVSMLPFNIVIVCLLPINILLSLYNSLFKDTV